MRARTSNRTAARFRRVGLAVCSSLLTGSLSAQALPIPLRTLTTARQAHNLPIDETMREYPVHFLTVAAPKPWFRVSEQVSVAPNSTAIEIVRERLNRLECQRPVEVVEEDAHVGDYAKGLAGATVAKFSGNGGIDVDANRFDPAGEHVAHGDRVEHRTEAEHEAGSSQVFGVSVLSGVHVDDGVWERTIITEASGENERHVAGNAFVHHAFGEASLLDGSGDGAGVIDDIDGAHVVAMAVLSLPAVGDADAKRRSNDRRFDVVDSKGIARQQGIHPAGADH